MNYEKNEPAQICEIIDKNNLKGIITQPDNQTPANGQKNPQRTPSLSKYQKGKIATGEQIKNFIKTLIALFPNNNDLFWSIVAKELILQQPAYEKLKDMYNFFLKEFPYRTITARDILGFNENINTFDVQQLAIEMDKNPEQAFAAIKINNQIVYCTLEDAQKTNADFNPLKSKRDYEN